jgi:hypothetical protein
LREPESALGELSVEEIGHIPPDTNIPHFRRSDELSSDESQRRPIAGRSGRLIEVVIPSSAGCTSNGPTPLPVGLKPSNGRTLTVWLAVDNDVHCSHKLRGQAKDGQIHEQIFGTPVRTGAT